VRCGLCGNLLITLSGRCGCGEPVSESVPNKPETTSRASCAASGSENLQARLDAIVELAYQDACRRLVTFAALPSARGRDVMRLAVTTHMLSQALEDLGEDAEALLSRFETLYRARVA